MNTIIIPTDFSPTATNAVHYALEMARAINARTLLFHVYNIPLSITETPVILLSVEELQRSAEQQLATLKSNIDRVSSGEVQVETIARLGDMVDELTALCDNIQPFAVILGTRGGSGIDSIFGSNTLSAVRKLTWPVIAVPAGKIYGTGIHKIGFACDYKDIANTTPAGVIRSFVQIFDAELHVLNVNTSKETVPGDQTTELPLLKSMLGEINAVYDFIEDNDVEKGINAFSEKNNLDLVIVIPKKHALLDGLFKKSATKQLVFHSHIPVMCIHE